MKLAELRKSEELLRLRLEELEQLEKQTISTNPNIQEKGDQTTEHEEARIEAVDERMEEEEEGQKNDDVDEVEEKEDDDDSDQAVKNQVMIHCVLSGSRLSICFLMLIPIFSVQSVSFSLFSVLIPFLSDQSVLSYFVSVLSSDHSSV